MSTVPAWAQRKLGWRRTKDKIFVFFCLLATITALLLLVMLLYGLWKSGGHRLSWSFLTEFPSRIAARAGIKSALWGSVWIVILTGLISIPIGIASAIYIEEFNPRKSKVIEFIQMNIANLAGVPSIVYGLLGLAVFVRTLGMGRSVIAGAATMSLLVLPLLITVCQEALRAVPQSYREGSLALGATQWQTIRRQVLPASASGIFTGIILALSRAMGETAPLIVVGAVAYVATGPSGLGDTYTVLPI
ncbi:MAG TPA: phosphate ABC transporter permease PstA [Fimbriimonadaceae bacterium]|nr:phosphate ABC transporter permease PstA [Fimbriimonadaceae bacterium]